MIRESPGSALMLENAQVGRAFNQLVTFVQRAERALSGPQRDLPELKLLLNDMQAFTAESLAMGRDTYIVGAKLVETQTNALLQNNLQILWLTGGQSLRTHHHRCPKPGIWSPMYLVLQNQVAVVAGHPAIACAPGLLTNARPCRRTKNFNQHRNTYKVF